MKKDCFIDVVRWILFIPGAFLFSYIISLFIKAFPEVLERMDLGITAISVFIANSVNSCIWGASFSISGLWIAPYKSEIVNAILSTIFAVVCLFNCWSSWYTIDGWWPYMSVVIFNVLALFGCIVGGLYYLSEHKRKQEERERVRRNEEYINTIRELGELRELAKKKNMTVGSKEKRTSVIERYRKYKEKNNIYKM